jgi:hypothetical protein
LTAQLTWGADVVQLTGVQGQGTIQGATLQWYFQTSSRGTRMLNLVVYTQSGYLPGGTPVLQVTQSGGSTFTLHGYTEDDASSWGQGVRWSAPLVVGDDGTYGSPAVSDKTLAIASYYLDYGIPFISPNQTLAYYSSRGPRIDGLDSIDLAAPPDHWTMPASLNDRFGNPLPAGSYQVGGGTSNATPFVVGVLALLKELSPTLTSDQLAAQLKGGARADGFTGVVPNDSWGRGKVGAWKATTTAPVPVGQAPVARGDAVKLTDTILGLDGGSSFDPEGGALRFRWDVGVDGLWDVGSTTTSYTTAALPAGVSLVRLEVADVDGFARGVLVAVRDAGAPPFDAGSTGGGAGGGSGAGGGGGTGGGTPTETVVVPALGTVEGPEVRSCATASGLPMMGLACWLLYRRRRDGR